MTDQSIQAHATNVRRSLETMGAILHTLKFPGDVPDKVRVALALLRASFDDAAGLVELARLHGEEFAGACFSLLRPMNEKFKRGTWIAFCATDEQLQNFLDGGPLPGGNQMAQAIEKMPPFDQLPVFSKLYENAGEKFHDFVHGGRQIAGAYTRGDGIGAAFGAENLKGALSHSEAVIGTGAQVIIMIAGEVVPDQALRALDEFHRVFLPQQQAASQT
ncbi:DUF6988 family protein [Dyella jiangningensis]|uniref:Uncharacterized protein n=1 Tax=Dyella jiangningensis TaxID=1379159 RepID=A0A328P5N7_9GAMM|nr:hypothetical protein [Dyella jiangningensis]RAO75915.1 hypothetical protein CA260_17980 [Dyella jiangningensis]